LAQSFLELLNFFLFDGRVLLFTLFDNFMDLIGHDIVVRCATYQFFHVAVQINSNSILFDFLINIFLVLNELVKLEHNFKAFLLHLLVLRPSRHSLFILLKSFVQASRGVLHNGDL
jgi:hypothetical protein